MTAVPHIRHGFVQVDDVRVFYREAGPSDAPTLLLLHDFPSSSHQFRRLMQALGAQHRLIAPDCPGSGHTVAPRDFAYSFDRLADVIERFVQRLGVDRFAMYLSGTGGAIGFRLATRHPEWPAGLIIQNANAYDEGLACLSQPTSGPAGGIRRSLRLPVTRGRYEGGAMDVELVSPDSWTLDQHFLDLPGRTRAQVELVLDDKSNLELYPRWQRWLRDRRPPVLIIWGRRDPLLLAEGAHAYLWDLPDAELHLFDTGRFVLEEKLPEIVPLIAGFTHRSF